MLCFILVFCGLTWESVYIILVMRRVLNLCLLTEFDYPGVTLCGWRGVKTHWLTNFSSSSTFDSFIPISTTLLALLSSQSLTVIAASHQCRSSAREVRVQNCSLFSVILGLVINIQLYNSGRWTQLAYNYAPASAGQLFFRVLFSAQKHVILANDWLGRSF